LKNLKITNRTKIKRLPKRGAYDIDTICKILDDTFICQVGFKINGQVYIIPTNFGRKDNRIYIHGSNKSRMLKSFESGEDICISISIIDGIVLARSAFHHSVNYRSVVIFARPEEITNEEEKNEALKIILEHIMPGRWEDVRKPNKKELEATSVFSFKIDESSGKIRTGPAADDKEDLSLNVWAGVLPLKSIPGEPINNKDLNDNILIPDYLNLFKRKKEKSGDEKIQN
jgi:nitroimidazol reductase NimA-like FMN-containing flavoprotein (pyridoxamine 5'-phosphate oxidase superfamily)